MCLDGVGFRWMDGWMDGCVWMGGGLQAPRVAFLWIRRFTRAGEEGVGYRVNHTGTDGDGAPAVWRRPVAWRRSGAGTWEAGRAGPVQGPTGAGSR